MPLMGLLTKINGISALLYYSSLDTLALVCRSLKFLRRSHGHTACTGAARIRECEANSSLRRLSRAEALKGSAAERGARLGPAKPSCAKRD